MSYRSFAALALAGLAMVSGLGAAQKVTVRFQAASESEIAAVFGLRMIRKEAER